MEKESLSSAVKAMGKEQLVSLLANDPKLLARVDEFAHAEAERIRVTEMVERDPEAVRATILRMEEEERKRKLVEAIQYTFDDATKLSDEYDTGIRRGMESMVFPIKMETVPIVEAMLLSMKGKHYSIGWRFSEGLRLPEGSVEAEPTGAVKDRLIAAGYYRDKDIPEMLAVRYASIHKLGDHAIVCFHRPKLALTIMDACDGGSRWVEPVPFVQKLKRLWPWS